MVIAFFEGNDKIWELGDMAAGESADDYEVRKIEVLAATGFDGNELLMLLFALMFFTVSVFYIRRIA